jgi:outer membrane receptor protein involved in Fe transport
MDDNAFQYDRNIYSAYTNYMQKLGKVSMQLGARFEQYEIDAAFNDGDELGTYSDKIFSIYPSLFLTYNPTEMNQFQASYSRRVDRPSANQVNPNRQWSTPLITSVGNPELQPQFTDSYELNYTRRLKKGSISFGTFYRQVHDNIFRILNVDPLDENKAELSFANGDSDNRYGIELSSSYRPAKWWMANASFDLYTKKATGIAGGQEIEVIDNSLNLRLNNTFKVGDKLSLQLFGMYRGASENLQFIREPMYMINAGASLSVLKKKGTLSLRVNDIFNTMGFNFESTNFFPSHGGFKWESRTAYVGFMYNFGRGDNKARRRRARDSNESSGGGGF